MQFPKNSNVKLSNIKVGGVFFFNKRMGIVIDRIPEDRSSGTTTVTFLDGESRCFIWDWANPDVEYMGKGKLEINIVME